MKEKVVGLPLISSTHSNKDVLHNEEKMVPSHWKDITPSIKLSEKEIAEILQQYPENSNIPKIVQLIREGKNLQGIVKDFGKDWILAEYIRLLMFSHTTLWQRRYLLNDIATLLLGGKVPSSATKVLVNFQLNQNCKDGRKPKVLYSGDDKKWDIDVQRGQ